MVSEVIKCINCGEINIVDEAKRVAEYEYEEKEDWTIKTTKTVRRKFKEMCGKKGMDFNTGLFYLLGLYTKEQHGMLDASFGVPGTR